MEPGAITCPYVSPGRQNCAAGPGEVCRWPDWIEVGPSPTYHAERIELAASMESNPEPVSSEMFEEAVLRVLG